MPATSPTAIHQTWPQNCPQTSTQTSTQTWTDERVELLKSHFAAGLSCREIAIDIGVSRNAVIGKLSRLNLVRGPQRPERKARQPKSGQKQANPRQQYAMLLDVYGEPEGLVAQSSAQELVQGLRRELINEGNRCSLLELEENRCRWPISTPGAADFCFCGNASPDGQPYCPGHSRLAYRPNSRLRVARG